MHVLPQLRKLEHSLPDTLVVVGVHSPKFTAERSTANLRQAVLRLEIEHPVLSDPDMRMWSEYAVRAWPTLMLVDPDGNVIGKHEGEIRAEEFQPIIEQMVAEFDGRGMLDRTPISFFQPEKPPDTDLLFPEKVLADPASGRLFVADSGHHRVIVATLDGQVQRVFGSVRGFRDGDGASALFDSPQGLALDGDSLYVADTRNHLIRRIDLATGPAGGTPALPGVSTIAGNGERHFRIQEGPALQTPLSSPWDVVFHQGTLYIAMAGSHQVWALNPRSGEILRYAGSGREALIDGPLARSTFAQPGGLAASERELFVADSETSAVRAVDLPGGNGQVRTLVGQGLFDFGDVDGVGAQVRLQHDLAVAFNPSPLPLGEARTGQRAGSRGEGGAVYVADSYNQKIKRIDPATGRIDSFAGSGDAELRDGVGEAAAFWEPGGLSLAEGKLYVADTNNHALRVVDLKTRQVSTLKLRGL